MADPGRGRFRGFLLASLRNFLSSQREHDNAGTRGGGQAALALEPGVDLVDTRAMTPEQVFERDYALTVIARALDRLREEAASAGKAGLFDQVSGFLLEPPDAQEYAELAGKLDMRRNTLAVAIHRLRTRLREMVRMELCETVDSPDALDAEILALRRALPGHAIEAGDATQAA